MPRTIPRVLAQAAITNAVYDGRTWANPSDLLDVSELVISHKLEIEEELPEGEVP